MIRSATSSILKRGERARSRASGALVGSGSAICGACHKRRNTRSGFAAAHGCLIGEAPNGSRYTELYSRAHGPCPLAQRVLPPTLCADSGPLRRAGLFLVAHLPAAQETGQGVPPPPKRGKYIFYAFDLLFLDGRVVPACST